MQKNNILNDLFYDLLNDGLINDEDENGLNMSGEAYAAIAEYMMEELVKYLQIHYNNLNEQIDALRDILRNAEENAKFFAGINSDGCGMVKVLNKLLK